MSITERERERETRQEARNRERGDMLGVQNVATYQPPGILAELKGRPIRIIATGDLPGHSPVVQYIDEDGRLDWEEQERITVVDSSFLPPSPETLRTVNKGFTRG